MGMKKTFTAAVAAVALLMTGLGASSGHAEERVFFGIATGGTGGTYYPLGGMLAQILSNSTALEGKKLFATAETGNLGGKCQPFGTGIH